MRKQLSQPSFQNGFARSMGESIRPDLWPDHAWIPALGVQGGTLFDVAGKRFNGTVTAGEDWIEDHLSFDTGSAGVSLGVSSISILPNSVWSIVTKFRLDIGSSGDRYIYDDTAGGGIGLRALNTNDVLAFWISGGTTRTISVATVLTLGKWSVLAFVHDGTTATLYLDGLPIGTNTYSGVIGNSGQVFRIGAEYNSNNELDGDIYSHAMYKNICLTPAQIRDLSADPLLPFRRKTFVSFYVPSSTPAAFKAFWYRNKNTLLGAG